MVTQHVARRPSLRRRASVKRERVPAIEKICQVKGSFHESLTSVSAPQLAHETRRRLSAEGCTAAYWPRCHRSWDEERLYPHGSCTERLKLQSPCVRVSNEYIALCSRSRKAWPRAEVTIKAYDERSLDDSFLPAQKHHWLSHDPASVGWQRLPRTRQHLGPHRRRQLEHWRNVGDGQRWGAR